MVTIAIQAGGGSRRMGRDKALVSLAGKPLIQHVLDRVHGLGDEVLVTTNRPAEHAHLGVRLAVDPAPDGGALVGLHTALSAARGETVLVLACDMPFLCRPLLSRLLELAPCGEVVVPRWRGEYEPLHAVYARSCLGAIEAVLRAGGRRMTEAYSGVRVHVVGEAEVAAFDPGGLSFHNLNTPEDVARAEELLRAGEVPS